MKKAIGVKPPAAPSFTLHIRTPLAAETVETVKLTGSDTVIDVVAKSPGIAALTTSTNMWIARDGKVLPIDWIGITQHGQVKTNYQILYGDQLFVQVNVGK